MKWCKIYQDEKLQNSGAKIEVTNLSAIVLCSCMKLTVAYGQLYGLPRVGEVNRKYYLTC